MTYTIQDPNEDKLHYVATATTIQRASELVEELHEIDRESGEESKYIIKRRVDCFGEKAKVCGWCVNCICMADDWETQCPARPKIK